MIIALIEANVPELFTVKRKDGTRFIASPSWTKAFIARELSWTLRHSTRAAQKIPANADTLLSRATLRQAFSIRNYAIPAALRVNSDQTQVVLQQGSKLTYEKRGAKQVTTHGVEEKRAFTLLVGLSANGKLLPFQSIWGGKTAASLLAPDGDDWEAATGLEFRFEVSGISRNYWSTEGTMKSYVTNTLVPYFQREKTRLHLPSDHPCLWQIDVWSVHASESFRTWMSQSYPWIILDYVPGGCTGLFQPCDVGFQRPLKLAIGRYLNEQVVREVSEKLNEGVDPTKITLDITLATLRNRSMGALVRAYHTLNVPNLIEKVMFHGFGILHSLSY
jgi:hypothetical protein